MWDWSENQIEIIFLRHGMTIENEQAPISWEYRYIFEQEWDHLKRRHCRKNGTYSKTDILFCSPMKRRTETAEILYPNHTPIYIYRSGGKWILENLKERIILNCRKNPNYQAWIDSNGTLPFPGGESRETFIKRREQGFYRMLIGIKGRLQKMDEKNSHLQRSQQER